jgi:tRNA dimethylallyltransferase
MAKNLVVILGPTASGKTEIAARLAGDLQGEIISADSRQVYRGMDIGTGKDLNQYIINAKKIPYHMIDIIDPQDEFNLFEFQKRFYKIFSQIWNKGNLPVLVGGTGLYLQAVLSGYEMPEALPEPELRKNLEQKSLEELKEIFFAFKPHLHNKTDIEDKHRLIRAIEIERARNITNSEQDESPEIDAVIFGISWERSVLRQRITSRLEERLKHGMIEEVERLHAAGLSWSRLDRFGLEYRYISQYLQNRISFDEMKNKLNVAIHQFAKRQETWFRRMERKGIGIKWIQANEYDLLKESVIKLFQSRV